jgi:hypothetical protein
MLLVTFALPPGFVLWQIQWSASNALHELPQEAARVTDLIAAIYQYEQDHSSWPRDISELDSESSQDARTRDWRYYRSDDPRGSAMLSWQGPMHTKLIYVFPSDAEPDLEEGWHASCEGNPVPAEIQKLMPHIDVAAARPK